MDHRLSGFSLVAGVNDNRLCREGWHDRAVDVRSGVHYRPTKRKASFDLFLPPGELELIALVSAGTSLCGGVLRGELSSNESLTGNFTLDSENWTLRRFRVSCAREAWTRFFWRIQNPYIPNDTLKNGDYREMGLYFAAMRFERIKL